MKKILSIIIVIVLLIALVGCSNANNNNPSEYIAPSVIDSNTETNKPTEKATETNVDETISQGQPEETAHISDDQLTNDADVAEESYGYETGDTFNIGTYNAYYYYQPSKTEVNRVNIPITWRILKISNGKALVVSTLLLDRHLYDPNHNDWEKSDIRAWLNDEFYNAAFSESEKALIMETSIETKGSKTVDSLFLLSYEEVASFFTSNDDRIAYFFRDKGNNTDRGTDWWLRNNGDSKLLGGCVWEDGSTSETTGQLKSHFELGVRPAFYIDLKNIP